MKYVTKALLKTRFAYLPHFKTFFSPSYQRKIEITMLFQTLKYVGIKDNPGKNCFVLLKITRELHLDGCMSLAFDV